MKKFLKILFKLVLILGIAAGAAYGGYYGYQQYQKREQAKATFTSRTDVEKSTLFYNIHLNLLNKSQK